MSCTLPDLLAIRYAHSILMGFDTPSLELVDDGLWAKLDEIRGLLVEVSPMLVDHELDCVISALLDIRDG